MVLDMEYREQERLEHGPGGPIFLLLSQLCPVSSTSLHHYRPGLASVLTAGLAQRSTHFMKIIYVEDSKVLLGVFKHQHLKFCKRDLRTPARVIM
jgi:hypothetical protein